MIAVERIVRFAIVARSGPSREWKSIREGTNTEPANFEQRRTANVEMRAYPLPPL
ncbi:hypothetical protein RHEC894_PE00344 (plasmid) [Rhizobium sp. CIAT894]|nr:hypothetical protein RHEC894_PE00344 [Rhizobium sp. CIAT894]